MTLLTQLDAPPAWRRIAFIADLHLGADTPRTRQRLIEWWQAEPADALFILGDLFEAWVGDDAASLPEAAALRQALHAPGRPLFFQHGNRDFLLGEAMGFALLGETCRLRAFGEPVLLVHGDAQCVDDLPYQAFRREVRAPAWQAAFLARPLADRQQLAAQMRDGSKRQQAVQRDAGLPFADPDAATCRALLQAADCALLVHGHTHRPGRYELGEGLARLVLSDWDFEQPDHPRGDCLLWSAAGWQRQPVWD